MSDVLAQAAHEAAGESEIHPDDLVVPVHGVVVHMPTRYSPGYAASLVDNRSGTPLWWGEGSTQEDALVDLAVAMAAELEERSAYLPDDYVDLADRADIPEGYHLREDLDRGTVLVPDQQPMEYSLWMAPAGARCTKCGCTQSNCNQCIAKTGRRCGWVAENLCSACVEPHEFDPHPATANVCAVCLQPPVKGDPVCRLIVSTTLSTSVD